MLGVQLGDLNESHESEKTPVILHIWAFGKGEALVFSLFFILFYFIPSSTRVISEIQ